MKYIILFVIFGTVFISGCYSTSEMPVFTTEDMQDYIIRSDLVDSNKNNITQSCINALVPSILENYTIVKSPVDYIKSDLSIIYSEYNEYYNCCWDYIVTNNISGNKLETVCSYTKVKS